MVSIIVPIYNADKYLLECLESIRVQTYFDIEVILVDDGSVDNSSIICRKICEKDKRFKYYYQLNQGPSVARNFGLEKVVGDYLMFADADDILCENAVEYMVGCMMEYNADLVICSFETFGTIKAETVGPKKKNKNCKTSQYISVIACDDKKIGGGFPFAKLWRVNAIKSNGHFINYDRDLKLYEDKLWVVQNAKLVNTIILIPTVVYKYRIVENSLSHKESVSRREQIVTAGKKIMEECENFCNPREFRNVQVMYGMQLMRSIYEKKKVTDQTELKYLEKLVKDIILSTNISFSSKLKYLYVYTNVKFGKWKE